MVPHRTVILAAVIDEEDRYRGVLHVLQRERHESIDLAEVEQAVDILADLLERFGS